MSGLRTGIFGGAFDPVHNGHVIMAEAARKAAGLDRVLFLPGGDPAHRQVHASAADRRAMVELAIRSNPRFALDDTALSQPGPVYTADTLQLLRSKYPHDELSFIAGADSLSRSVWRRLDEVAAALHRFYVVAREGVAAEEVARVVATVPPELRAKFQILGIPPVAISGTDLRARVAQGLSIDAFVAPPVAQYIERHELYRM